MKKKIIVLALCVLMISGCGSKIPKLSNGDEAVVTLKDDSMISVNELYSEIKDDYALQALVNMVDKKILEDKYSDKVESAKSETESYMIQLESIYGDDLEAAIQNYTGYQTKEAFKDAYYVSILQNYAITDYCKQQIKEKEVKNYYKKEIVGDIKVSHILITPEVKDSMTDEEKEAAEAKAKETVNLVINKLKNTKSSEIKNTFAELAKEYSQDETTKQDGGSLGFINKDTLSSDYDELVKAAYKLKDGEYSTKVITTELGYHIILRVETKDKAELEDVRDSILETLADKYLEENPVAAVKGLQAVRKEYKMEIVDSELAKQYATYIQNQINSYESSKNNGQ